MYQIEEHIPPQDAADDRLVAPFEQRQKSRARVTLASGAEAGLFLPRGTVLRHGDCLRTRCGRVVRVEAAPEQVLTVRADSPEVLLRAAYHLGNRHVQMEIAADWLRLGFDPVLRDMLLGLGVEVAEEEAPFEPEAGAYQGAHAHHQGHGEDAPIIHTPDGRCAPMPARGLLPARDRPWPGYRDRGRDDGVGGSAPLCAARYAECRAP